MCKEAFSKFLAFENFLLYGMHERACFNKIVTTQLHMEGGKST